MTERERKRRAWEKKHKTNPISAVIGTIFAIILLIKGYQAIKENYAEHDEEEESYSVSVSAEESE